MMIFVVGRSSLWSIYGLELLSKGFLWTLLLTVGLPLGTAHAQTPPITPVAASPQQAGTEFWVDVKVGSDDTPVSDLFGVSFVLNYEESHLSVLEDEAGSFLGNDLVYSSNDDAEAGEVGIGVSRKSGDGGVDGSGVVARVKFKVGEDAPDETTLSFSLKEVEADDPDGDAIALDPRNENVTIPVELTSFEATRVGEGTVRLSWKTASETNNAGFRAQRQVASKEPDSWTNVGFVEGAGTTSKPQSYRFVDEELPYADALIYRLKQVDTDGTAHYSKEVTVHRTADDIELLAPAPNPAQRRATVQYAVPKSQDVEIRLYDVLGRQVGTVVNKQQKGRHARRLDVSGLPSGVYLLRLVAEDAVKTRRLTVVR